MKRRGMMRRGMAGIGSTATLVMGGLLGDEGKGCFARWKARLDNCDTAIRTGGPNAGHSCEIGEMHQLPTCSDMVTWVLVPRAALIHVPTLLEEYERVLRPNKTRLYVHPMATIITELGQASEFGTMGMGIGKTRAQRCLKRASIARDVPELRVFLMEDPDSWDSLWRDGHNIMIEGSQGYGLSLHGWHYPYCTSGDLNPHQMLSDIGAPFRFGEATEVCLVYRPITIRVPGNSGPLDREFGIGECRLPVEEESWGVNKGQPKRAGAFDKGLARRSLAECNPDATALTFAQYMSVEEVIALEDSIGRKFNWMGVDRDKFISRHDYLHPIGTPTISGK